MPRFKGLGCSTVYYELLGLFLGTGADAFALSQALSYIYISFIF
jgi:hypothetical protein